MANVLFIIVFRQILSRRIFSSTHALLENREAYARTQKWQPLEDRPNLLPQPSNRFGQSPQNVSRNSLLDRSRQVNQDSYVNVQFGIRMREMVSGSSAPRADRSDQFTGAVKLVLDCVI